MFGDRKRVWQAKGVICQECGLELTAHRGCQEVVLRCPKCGAEFDLRQYISDIDEDFEEEMGFVPMDRI